MLLSRRYYQCSDFKLIFLILKIFPESSTTNHECGVRRTSSELQTRQDLLRTDTEEGEWPHMCAIYQVRNNQTTFVAGASLIAPKIVLTVAHWTL